MKYLCTGRIMLRPTTPETIRFRRSLSAVVLPLDWEAVSPAIEGYCYLNLYSKEHHQKVAYLLGVYPLWRDVKALGGHRDGLFNVVRMGENYVHIISGGMGYSARYLSIKDNDRVGVSHDSCMSRGCKTTAYPAAVETEVSGPLKADSGLLKEQNLGRGSSNLIGDRFTEGRLPKRRIRHKSLEGKWMVFKLFAILFPLVTAPVNARLTRSFVPSLDSDVYDFTAQEKSVVRGVHQRYMDSYSNKLEDVYICTSSPPLRYDILSLDLDDEVLVRYITNMCPQLKGRDPEDWRIQAEDLAIRMKENWAGDTASRAYDLLHRTKNAVTTGIAALASSTKVVGDEFYDVGGKLFESTVKFAAKSSSKAVGSLDEVLEKLEDKPAVAVSTVGFFVDEVDRIPAKKFYNETLAIIQKGMSTAYSNLPDVEFSVNATSDVVKTLFGDAANITKHNYNSLIDMWNQKMTEIYTDEYKLSQDGYRLWEFGRSVIRQGWSDVKDIKAELAPLDAVETATELVPRISQAVGEAAGNLIGGGISGATKALPTKEDVANSFTFFWGEKVTSRERIEKAKVWSSQPYRVGDLLTFGSTRIVNEGKNSG